jgi:hypothetical protein
MTKENRRSAFRARWLPPRAGLAVWLLAAVGCGAGPRPAAAPPCDQQCQDGVALLGLRTAMKLAYNFEVSTKPVGAQDGTAPCVSFDGSQAGTVHVFGTASVNAIQGASIVSLTYNFKNCLYSAPPDPTANQNFSLKMNGEVTEDGTLSVQPTSTTALSIGTVLDDSTMLPTESLSISGTVYDPPVDYAVSSCALSVIQDGNSVSGALCGRSAGFTFDN